jgi:spore coat protein A, manganese oxidase
MQAGGGMSSRRNFIRAGTLIGAGLFVPSGLAARHRAPRTDRLRRFIDPLPRPRVLAPFAYDGTVPIYRIAASEFTQQLHSDLPPTTLWGYDGTYPGPTIEARRNQPLRVIWANELGTGAHLLPVDRTLHGTDMSEPDRRIVTHLHGGIVPPDADGFPESWFTDGYAEEYEYPNTQRATTLWYHDHSLGITRLNVQAGLAAFYLLRDAEEDALIAQGLPADEFEIPIAMQDRSFHEDGSLYYPAESESEIHPVWTPEFFGDVPVVNGVAYPVLEVQPRRYRLRLLNGCNARFLNLQLFRYTNRGYRGNGPAFVMIGADGGLLPAPVTIAQDNGGTIPRRLLMAPAERADVIVDFSAFAGQELVLHNNAPAPFSGFAQGNARPPVHRPGHPIGADLPEIMLFRVSNFAAAEQGVIPSVLSPSFSPIDSSSATLERDIVLEEVMDAEGEPVEALLQGRHWADAGAEDREFGSTEIWKLVNLTGDSHPIHLHLDHFQLMWRRAFNPTRYVVGYPIEWRGPASPPAPEASGWKDTVVAHPGEVTAIAVRSDSYRGEYPYHCHILEHEDNEMMARFTVT